MCSIKCPHNTNCLLYQSVCIVTCAIIINHHWFLLLDRLPPFAKDVIDEFHHGLGATVTSAVCTVLKVLHYMTDELREDVGYLHVVLSCRNLLEVAGVLLSQGSTFLLIHLPGTAQVLLVPHQEDWSIHQSGTEEAQTAQPHVAPTTALSG